MLEPHWGATTLNGADLLLATLALCVGLVLARLCVPTIRALLFVSTLVVSGLLFIPGATLKAWVGAHRVDALEAVVARTPWDIPDWVHLAAFFWLTLLLWVGCRRLRNGPGVLLLCGLAVAAEFAQWLTDSREVRLADAGINLLGVATGVCLGAAWVWRTRTAPVDAGTP
ncbi:hypothetical protein GCM10028862_03760 [Luteimonas pelagia]